MTTPLYKKGEIHHCLSCDDFLFEVAHDIFIGELISKAIIKSGQEFKSGDRPFCKRCSYCFIKNNLLNTKVV